MLIAAEAGRYLDREGKLAALETPIERVTPLGIKTSDAEYEFDLIIYATGFDAMTGTLLRMGAR